MRTVLGVPVFWWMGGVLLVCASVGLAVPVESRTADMPDSWLVLYNLNNPDSATWAAWYQQQRGIPSANLIGLNASLDEHLADLNAVQTQIITPVRDLLVNNSAVEQNTMGIILGYGLPGHYGVPPNGPPGGFSVTDALEDMYDDTLAPAQQQGYNDVDNPQFAGGAILPTGGRLTKATMEPRRYMVARIDGPTLQDAMALTERALVLENPNHTLLGEYIYYDFLDNVLPGGEWYWLHAAVDEPALQDLPWMAFDADTQQTPNDAMRFGTHDIGNWNNGRLDGVPAGSRVLAFNYNSWGATTVRSTTADNARYVPNALAAGYAAAIGSTGEPNCCLGPIPETLLAGLREGWTLGESFHIAAVYDDWMWTLVGDPFLTLPNWFNPLPAPTMGDGDVNFDGAVNGLDIPGWVGVFTGAIVDPATVAAADMDGNGLIDEDDLFLLRGPMLYGTSDPIVLMGGGDANADGAVNGADTNAFVQLLLQGTAGVPIHLWWPADMNQDGVVTINDVPLFVTALLAPTP